MYMKKLIINLEIKLIKIKVTLEKEVEKNIITQLMKMVHLLVEVV